MKRDLEKKESNLLENLGRDPLLLSSISDAIDSLVVVLDGTGRIIWYNRACEKTTGLSPYQAQKQYYWDIFCPPQEAELYKEFFYSLQPQDFPCEVETYHQDGKKTAVIVWRNSIFQESDGEIRYHVMTGTDLTQNRESQQKILEMGEQYRALIHASPVAFVLLDPHGFIMRWSSAAEQIFGFSEKEVKGKPITHFFQNKQETIQDYLQMTLGRRSFHNLEFASTGKGGDLVYLDISLAPLYNYRGEVNRLLMVINDISARKKAQQQLQKQLLFQEMVAFISQSLVNISPSQLEQGIYRALQKSGEFFSMDRSFFLWFSYEQQDPDTVYQWCAEDVEPLEVFPQLQLIEGDKPCQIPDVELLPQEQKDRKESLKEQGIASLLLIPMLENGSVKGVLGYDNREGMAPWTQKEISRFQVVGEIIFGVFTRIAYQKALQKSEEYNRSIVELIPDRMIRLNREGKFLDIIKSSQGDLFLSRDDLLEKTLQDVLPSEEAYSFLQGIKRALETGLLQRVDYSLMIPTGNIWFEARIIPYGDGEVMALIRNVTEQKMGERRIQGYNRQLKLQQQELEELYRQLDEEISKARSIHETGLLQEFPSIEGLSIAAFYQPAQNLGGDFYYVLQKGNKLVIYLSDVTGHGLDGAMLSAFVKNTINSYLAMAQEEEITPEAMIAFLTEQYQKERYPSEYFLSIYLAVLDLMSWTLHYLGAGFQDFPLLFMGEGEIQELDNTGLPISPVIPDDLLNTIVKTIDLPAGSTLLFTTDGLTEQLVKNIEYKSRLKPVFSQHASYPPEVMVYAVNEDFKDFNQGSGQGDDDITFLVLQLDPVGTKKYHFQLKSHFQELWQVRQEMEQVLSPSQEREWFLMALHELVANAIEHGNQFHPQKMVEVKVTTTGEYFFASIRDEGKGFHWRERMENTLEMEGKTERGRGLSLTRIFCQLFYNEAGNKAYLMVKRQQRGNQL